MVFNERVIIRSQGFIRYGGDEENQKCQAVMYECM